MSYLKTLAEAKEALADYRVFSTGTLSATFENDAYIVRSYGVKIAGMLTQGVMPKYIMPNAYTHSKTTSKHANIVKRAWGLI